MKRKKDNKDNNANALEFIIEGRLALQSVQRYLIGNKLPINNLFLRSAKFREDFYSKWPEYKKKEFLEILAGPHWRKMKELIEH